MKKTQLFHFFIFLAALVIYAETAGAQVLLSEEHKLLNLPVEARKPEAFKPEGMEFKGFVYIPQLSVNMEHDTNIFAQSANEREDQIVTLRPSLDVGKTYDGHSFLAGVNAEIKRYNQREQENQENFGGYFRGLLVGNRSWQFPIGIGFNRNVKARQAPTDSALTEEPVRIKTFSGSGGVIRSFNRLSVSLIGGYRDVSLEDGEILGGGQTLVFRDGDHMALNGRLGLRYELPRGSGDGHILYANFDTERQIYDNRQFDGNGFSGIELDRTIYNALAGFETSYKGLLFANIGAGYLYQTFDDPTIDSVGNIDFSAQLEYNVLPKLTLGLSASRTQSEESLITTGYVKTGIGATADYELRHDLYAGISATFSNSDFNTGTREDDETTVNTYLRYLLNQNIEAQLGVRQLGRDSTTPTNEFDKTEFIFSLTGRL